MRRFVLALLCILIPDAVAHCRDKYDYNTGIDAIECYIESGETEKAESLLEKMAEAYPENDVILDRDTVMDTLNCYMKKGAVEEAAELIEKILQMQPEDDSSVLLTYEEGIDILKQHIRDGNLNAAEKLLGEMQKRYPDNPEIISIHARVLFWQKKYDESIEEYSRALQIQEDESLKRELEKVEIAGKLQEADLKADKGETRQAKELLKNIFDSGKGQYEAGYRLGMLYIKGREYDKAAEVFHRLRTSFPDDKDFLALYIEALILNGDVQKAKEELGKLSAVERDLLYRTREDIFYRAKRNYLKLSGGFLNYTGDYKDGHEESVEVSQRIGELTFMLNTGGIYRFGLYDTQISLDIYSRLGERTKRWGFLSFSASPDASFLPETSFGGEIYQGYGDFESSFGYRRMNFKNASVDIFIPGIIAYLPYRLSLSERLYIVPKNNSYSLLSTLHYEPNHKFRAFYSIAFGNAAERIGSEQDIQRVSTISSRLGAEYRLRPCFSLGAELSFENRDWMYKRYGITIFSRHWW